MTTSAQDLKPAGCCAAPQLVCVPHPLVGFRDGSQPGAQGFFRDLAERAGIAQQGELSGQPLYSAHNPLIPPSVTCAMVFTRPRQRAGVLLTCLDPWAACNVRVFRFLLLYFLALIKKIPAQRFLFFVRPTSSLWLVSPEGSPVGVGLGPGRRASARRAVQHDLSISK